MKVLRLLSSSRYQLSFLSFLFFILLWKEKTHCLFSLNPEKSTLSSNWAWIVWIWLLRNERFPFYQSVDVSFLYNIGVLEIKVETLSCKLAIFCFVNLLSIYIYYLYYNNMLCWNSDFHYMVPINIELLLCSNTPDRHPHSHELAIWLISSYFLLDCSFVTLGRINKKEDDLKGRNSSMFSSIGTISFQFWSIILKLLKPGSCNGSNLFLMVLILGENDVILVS